MTTNIDKLIADAAKKVNATKENDICRYLPGEADGYIHHFTMRKMRTEDPKRLAKMIEDNIIKPKNPVELPPKKRAARGSRKRRDQILFSRDDLDKLRNLARMSGDREILRKLAPPQDEKTLRRQLLSSIRRGEADQDLWNAWSDLQRHRDLTDTADLATASAGA